MAVEGGYGSAAQFQLMAGAAAAATGQVGRLVQNIAAVQGIIGTVTFAARAFATLEQQLVLTNAVAEGTAKNFKEMQKAVQDASLATKFSAVENTNALYALAAAGLSVDQSISAMTGVLALAQATMTDVASSADTVSSALSAFQLSANNSTRIANLFTASINQSQADMPKLAYAMRQVAPVAAASGISIEQLTASMNTLFNVGLRGEQTGTALRNIITNLANPTRDASDAFLQLGVATQKTNGQARDLFVVLKELSKANPSTATQKTLFGADALAGSQALLNASSEENYRKRLESDREFAAKAEAIARRTGKVITTELQMNFEGISGTNSAFEVAAKQMATLSGSFSTATNAITLLATSLGQTLAPTLRTVANAITDMGVSFQGLSDHQKSLITQLPLIAAGAYGLYRAVSPLRNLFDSLGGASAMASMFAGAPTKATTGQVVGAFGASLAGNLSQVAATARTGLPGQFGFGATQTPIQPPHVMPPGTLNPAGVNVGGQPYSASQVASGRFGAGFRDAAGQALGSRSITPIPAMIPGPTVEAPGTTAFRTNLLGAVLKSVTLLGTAGIALYGIYEIGKLIFDYLKINRDPSATIGKTNVGAEVVRQVQATSLTTPNAYERMKTFEEMNKSLDTMDFDRRAATDVASGNKARASEAAIKRYNAMVPNGVGQNDLSSLQDLLLGEGGKPLDLNNKSVLNNITGTLRGQNYSSGQTGSVTITKEEIAALQEEVRKWALAKQEQLTLNENYKEFGAARVVLLDAMDTAKQLPSYTTGKTEAEDKTKKEETEKLLDRMKENQKRTIIEQTFIQEFERAARDRENMVNKARASLSVNPLETFVLDQITENYATAKEITDQTTKAENDIREKFGARIAGRGDIAKMLAGASYTDMVLNEAGDGYVAKQGAPQQKSVAAMIEAGGFTKEQILGRYDEVVKQALSQLSGIDAEAKGILERFYVAQRKTFEKAIEERQLTETSLLRGARSKARDNREYIIAMRERLVQGQLDVYREVAAGAAEIDPQFGSQQAIRELFQKTQSSTNAFQQVEEAFFAKFAPDAGTAGQRSGTQAEAEFSKYRDSFSTSLKKLFQFQLGNIIAEGKSARAKALDTLKSNASDIKAQNAAIAQELYTFTGDPSFLAEAVTADATAAAAQADRTIASLRERSRNLGTNIAKANAATGLNLPGVPEVNVPQETKAFQEKSVVLLQEIATNTARLGVPVQTTASGVPSVGGGSFGLGGVQGPSRGSIAMDQSDLEKVIRTVYAEAGGESEAGRQAVAEVIRNRAATWGKSAGDVVTQNNGTTFQFEPWKPSSSGYQRMMDFDVNSDKGQEIRKIVEETFAGKRDDLTGGAMNFLNASTVKARGTYNNANGLPDWAQGTPLVIGNHSFHNPNGKTVPVDISGADAASAAGVPKADNTNTVRNAQQATAATQAQSEATSQLNEYLKTQFNITGDYSTNLDTLLPKLKERGATESQIAQVTELATASTGKLVEGAKRELAATDSLASRYEQLKAAKQAYFSTEGYKAYSAWDMEGQALDMAGKSLQRNGSIIEGMQFSLQKTRHNMSTDFQLSADAFSSFTDKSSGILAGMITGTEKDWKASVANMLQDISQAIIKALLLRTLTGGANSGDGGGLFGGLLGGVGSLFGGGGGMAALAGGPITAADNFISAKGNMFHLGRPLNDNVIEHATGGIVGSKQYFPMSKSGQVGSISETGAPEAIMPLARTTKGQLGIEVAGGQQSGPNGSPYAVLPLTRGRGGRMSVDLSGIVANTNITNVKNVRNVAEHATGGLFKGDKGTPVASAVIMPTEMEPRVVSEGGSATGVQTTASRPTTISRGGSVSNTMSASLTFSPTYQGGSDKDKSGATSEQQRRDMQKEFSEEMEASMVRFVDKQSAPGGRFFQPRKYA